MQPRVIVLGLAGDPAQGSTRGVFEKLRAQVSALRRLGYNAKGIFGVLRAEETVDANECIEYLKFDGGLFGTDPKRFFALAETRVVQDEPDILYVRYPLASPSFRKFLRSIRDKVPSMVIAVERQTKELHELTTRRSFRNIAKAVREVLYRRAVQEYVDVNIGVTEEISRYVKGYCPQATCISSGNGIAVDLIEPNEAPKARGTPLRLIFVGNITPWSGLDKFLVALDARLRQEKEQSSVIVDIVGDGVFLPQLKQLAGTLAVPIVFHGHQSGPPLLRLMSEADLAIGAFGNKDRGLAEGSNLKLRLYCALGVPFVHADIDADFPVTDETNSFALHVGGRDLDSGLVGEILRFSLACRENPDLSNTMRLYARRHLTWDAKMGNLIPKLAATRRNVSTSKLS